MEKYRYITFRYRRAKFVIDCFDGLVLTKGDPYKFEFERVRSDRFKVVKCSVVDADCRVSFDPDGGIVDGTPEK
jgi:hypothetical protein